jgi:hypothetical protein
MMMKLIGYLTIATMIALATAEARAQDAGIGTKPVADNPAPGALPADNNGGTPAGEASAKEIDAIVATAAEAVSDRARFPRGDGRSAWTGKAQVNIYFLPNGQPAEPLPVDLSERDEITLYAVIPDAMRGAMRLEVNACPSRDLYRLNGDFAAAKKIASGQAKGSVATYVASPLGRLRCGSGQVSFHVGLIDKADPSKESAGASHTLTLGSVYWGTVGVQFTFDFTKSNALSVEATPTGAVIARSHDLLGPKVVPIFLWHPFGLDPDHPSILGTLFNPSLGFDLDSITSSFFMGDSACWSGLCLCAGTHIRKTDQLKPASGLGVGDSFDTTKGTLPVDQRWSSSSGGIGFFAGAVLDVNTAAKIISGTK